MRGRILTLALLAVLIMAVAACLFLGRDALRRLLRELLPERPFRVVVLDPGHGGKDPGAVVGGLREKDIVLDLASRIHSRLLERGFRVVMTRFDDSFLSLPERVSVGNSSGNAVFISLHLNTEATGTAEGIETYYYDSGRPDSGRDGHSPADIEEGDAAETGDSGATIESADAEPPASPSARLALSVHSALATSTLSRDRGTRNYPFHVLRNAHVPAILIEAGFLSHPDERRLLTSPAYLDILAEAITSGIAAHQQDETRRIAIGRQSRQANSN